MRLTPIKISQNLGLIELGAKKKCSQGLKKKNRVNSDSIKTTMTLDSKTNLLCCQLAIILFPFHNKKLCECVFER